MSAIVNSYNCLLLMCMSDMGCLVCGRLWDDLCCDFMTLAGYTGGNATLCTGINPTLCTGVSPTLCTGVSPTLCTGVSPTLCTGITSVIALGDLPLHVPGFKNFLHFFLLWYSLRGGDGKHMYRVLLTL